MVFGPRSVIDLQAATSRVAALRAARPHRRDLSEPAWQSAVLLLYPGLREAERQSASTILAAIAAHLPPAHRARYDGLTSDEVLRALVDWQGPFPPSQDDLARVGLSVTDRRVRQVLRAAGTTWSALLEDAQARRDFVELS